MVDSTRICRSKCAEKTSHTGGGTHQALAISPFSLMVFPIETSSCADFPATFDTFWYLEDWHKNRWRSVCLDPQPGVHSKYPGALKPPGMIQTTRWFRQISTAICSRHRTRFHQVKPNACPEKRGKCLYLLVLFVHTMWGCQDTWAGDLITTVARICTR